MWSLRLSAGLIPQAVRSPAQKSTLAPQICAHSRSVRGANRVIHLRGIQGNTAHSERFPRFGAPEVLPERLGCLIFFTIQDKN